MKSKKLTRKSLDKYFQILDIADDEYSAYVQAIEDVMRKDTGVRDLEFVYADGGIVGIGTPARKKKIPLIHR
jgi:hypothetical protein